MSEFNVRWAFNIKNWTPKYHEIKFCTSCIQLEEKERLGKFVFKPDFISSLIGRLLLRKFVSSATKTRYKDIIFNRDDRGKPILKYPPIDSLKFNVSHQGDYVVLAGSKCVTESSFLGVDVMKIEYKREKSLSEFFRVMNRQFSPAEWKKITENSNELDQIRMFFRHWCLKESFVKAVGVGITVDLQSISFKINTDQLKLGEIVCDSVLSLNGIYEKDWEFHESLLDQEHCVAVALKNSNPQSYQSCKMGFSELNFNNLMENAEEIIETDEEYCKKFFEKLDK